MRRWHAPLRTSRRCATATAAHLMVRGGAPVRRGGAVSRRWPGPATGGMRYRRARIAFANQSTWLGSGFLSSIRTEMRPVLARAVSATASASRASDGSILNHPLYCSNGSSPVSTDTLK